MSPKKNSNTPKVYKLKFTLKDIKPPIWRRLLVCGDDTLADLHDMIQISMSWLDCHLHEFSIHDKLYGPQDEDCPLDVLDDTEYKLDDVLKGKKTRFKYVYDFGDNWTMDILVEGVEPLDPEKQYPVCLAGKRRGPLEDSGGPWGYAMKVEVLQDPGHPDYEEVAEWMDEDWDPEYFDRAELNEALQQGPSEDAPAFEDLDEEEQDALLESMLEADPFLEERVARLHDRIAKIHELETPEAVHDFIEAMPPEELRAFAAKHFGENPDDAAFELGLLALESADLEEAADLADRALKLDPRNVDARIVQSNIAVSEGDYDRGLALLREALAVATENLGEKYFTKSAGDFTDLVETRPYLRARFVLGHTLQEMNEAEAAAEQYRAMLEREPEDLMGARYPLAGLLLELDQLKDVRSLVAEYPSADDLIFPWVSVLERFLSGKKKEAKTALQGAIAANPLMVTSLLEPASIEDLDLETDLGVATSMALTTVGKAWFDHPKALEWLASEVYEK